MDAMPFHSGERAVQARAGVHIQSAGIRDCLPDPHRSFFAQLPMLFMACADETGWPLATLLEGDPGFVNAPDAHTLQVRALPDRTDPAAGSLPVGQAIGLLGIDLSTRRRNRANGIVTHRDDHGFSMQVRQSFGNCPQYIQRRTLARTAPMHTKVRKIEIPDAAVRALIERADTCFVATRSRADAGPAGGADLSHRGGRPGFVRIDGDTLLIPDFRGNGYFNTLGNIQGEPRASLLFLDFETGAALQLQGLARIGWDDPETAQMTGAARVWRFRIVRGWHRTHAMTLRGTLVDYSPSTLRTGIWKSRDAGGRVR